MYSNIFQALRFRQMANKENRQNTKGWCQGIIDNMYGFVSPRSKTIPTSCAATSD